MLALTAGSFSSGTSLRTQEGCADSQESTPTTQSVPELVRRLRAGSARARLGAAAALRAMAEAYPRARFGNAVADSGGAAPLVAMLATADSAAPAAMAIGKLASADNKALQVSNEVLC
jgi:hypothetical protein